jgi:DNA-binding CsgD family transcriptional regulator
MGVARTGKQEMRPTLGIDAKHGSVIDPAIEKYLLALHAALDVDSFWEAIRELIGAAIPNQVIGLTLQHSPILPLTAEWTAPMADGFFLAQPLRKCVSAEPRKKVVRVMDLFSNRRAFTKSTFFRRYVASQECAHVTCLLFWQKRRLICAIVIMRTATQGDLSPVEIRLLRQLYPQVSTALQRLESLERERAVRMDLEEFVKRLPLPTMLLRWNLKLLFRNRAARDFCAVWEKGFERARLLNTNSPIPPEILDRCRSLKQKLARSRRSGRKSVNLEAERVSHAASPDLRAVIRLKQLNSAVARPHFLIECEDSSRLTAAAVTPASLPHLARLTGREQEVARLVCNGQSNQEVADAARLSLPMVKKHLHAVFRKLEVTSRSQLMALML